MPGVSVLSCLSQIMAEAQKRHENSLLSCLGSPIWPEWNVQHFPTNWRGISVNLKKSIFWLCLPVNETIFQGYNNPNDGETQICHESSRSLLHFTFHLFEGLPHTHILAEHNCLSSQQIHQGDLSSNVKDKEMPLAAWRKLCDICWRKALGCYGNPEI